MVVGVLSDILEICIRVHISDTYELDGYTRTIMLPSTTDTFLAVEGAFELRQLGIRVYGAEEYRLELSMW